jgi:RNase P protein component
LIREHIRLTMLGRLPAIDVVIRALPTAYATEAVELRSELTDMARRALDKVS